jgi:hypothetical protein
VNLSLSLLIFSFIFSNMAVITSDSDLDPHFCLLDSPAAVQVACNLVAVPALYFQIRKAGCLRFINTSEYLKLQPTLSGPPAAPKCPW